MPRLLKKLRRLAGCAIVTLLSLFSPLMVQSAYSTCNSGIQNSVVLLEALRGPDASKRSGIVVSSNGMILTDFGLIRELLGDDMSIMFDPTSLLDHIRIELTHDGSGPIGSPLEPKIAGFDIARNLLLLKVGASSREKVIPKISISNHDPTQPMTVCVAGFKNQTNTFAPSSDPFLIKGTGDISWETTDVPITDLTAGSAVYSPDGGEILGMVVSGNPFKVIPIHFADTILSNIFLADLIREVQDIKKSAIEFQAGITYDFKVLEDTVNIRDADEESFLEFPDFNVRVFVQRLSRSRGKLDNIKRIRVKPKVSGTTKDGDEVTEDDFDPLTPPWKRGRTFIDIDASGIIGRAREKGIYLIQDISLTFSPIFENKKKGRPRTIVIPLADSEFIERVEDDY